jgi:hypothetical protein
MDADKGKGSLCAKKSSIVENRVNPNSRLLALSDKSSQSSGLTFGADRKKHFLERN